MKKVSCLWLLVAIIASFFATYLRFETKELESETEGIKNNIREYESLIKSYESYAVTKNNSLNYVNDDLFKQQIDTIAKASHVKIAEFRNEKSEYMYRGIALKLTGVCEKNCYQFLHLLENGINGVLKCNALSLMRKDGLVVLKLKANIYYCNLQCSATRNRRITNENLRNLFEYELLKQKEKYTLHGIIGESALINNKIVKVGDTINEKIIESITDKSVILKSRSDTRRSVVLGETFW